MSYLRKYGSLILLLVGLNLVSAAQSFRVGTEFGVSLLAGDLTRVTSDTTLKDITKPGFNFAISAERFYNDHIAIMLRIGYTMYQLDIDKIEKAIATDEPGMAKVDYTSYQNFSLMAGFGYSIPLFKEKLLVQPYVYAGLGAFKSAYIQGEVQTDSNSVISVLYEGDLSANLLLVPGLAVNISLNSLLELKLFGEYALANYHLKERGKISDGSVSIEKNYDVTYQMRALNIGLGIAAHF